MTTIEQVSKNSLAEFKNKNYILVKNTRSILHKLATNFYGNPQDKLKIVAVTGTNGKTTITSLLHHIFENSTLIGTVKNEILKDSVEAINTTPGQIEIMKIFKESVDRGVRYVFMEVSSHSIAQKRIEGLKFDYVILTNITQDHLDFHKDFEDYKSVKLSLINHLKDNGKLIINSSIREHENYNCITYGLNGDFTYRVKKSTLSGMEFEISNGEKVIIKTKLIGTFNCENILAAYIVAKKEGLSDNDILKKVNLFEPVDGRFNVIKKYDRTVIVDFAHSPDALMNSIKTAKSLSTGRLIVVFGAGGHADSLKRPIMGNVATKNSDITIITNDNPYYENEYTIINQILQGISKKKVFIIPNRRQAIRKALTLQTKNDLVLICGKGHEKFIIYDDRLIPFYDKGEVVKILDELYD
jgi:UDP-N-acetylmuramoyl-L-alanyl-D-glutamate--2,6-diaminopimelate ligase